MSCYQINGGTPLRGRLAVQGAKNSVLPILAAALLAPGESMIHNCPDLSDVTATLDILRLLGCRQPPGEERPGAGRPGGRGAAAGAGLCGEHPL